MSLNIWETIKAPFASRALFGGGANQVRPADVAKDNAWQDYAFDPNGNAVKTFLPIGASRAKTHSMNPNGFSTYGSALSTPAAPTVTPTGGSGTTWTYVIVAMASNFTATTAASATGTTAVGGATLSTTVFNTITWAAVTGAMYYGVFRTVAGGTPSTTGLVAIVSTNSYIDIGGVGDGSTAPTVNTTGIAELVTTTGFTIVGVPNAANVKVTPTGGSATTWTYGVVALDSAGDTTADVTASTTTGGATLSATVFNTITWDTVPNSVAYRVYRTAAGGTPSTTGLIATVTPINANTQSYVDIGGAGDSSTAPTTNTTGTIHGLSNTSIPANYIQSATYNLTLANLLATNTVPFSLLAAQGTGTLIEVVSMTLDLIRGSAAFSGGGACAAYLGTNSSGVLASATIAATVFTSFAASQIITVAGALAVNTSANTLNKGLVFANPTADFTSGTGATGIIKLTYRVHTGLS